jgi:hypothetical protein
MTAICDADQVHNADIEERTTSGNKAHYILFGEEDDL